MSILALAFVSGAWVLQQMPFLPGLYWAGLLLPLALLARWLPTAFRSLLWVLLALAAGFLWADLRAQLRLADALSPAWEGQTLEVIGVVASLPQAQENGLRFEFDVERVLTAGAGVPRHISLAKYDNDFPSGRTSPPTRAWMPHAGERWQLSVRLKRPHGTANPHGFDFEAWALEHNIRATGYVRKDARNQRLDALVWHPPYLVEAAREQVGQRMARVLEGKPYAGILRALVIGDESGIAQQDWQVFLRTGTNHLMSISGLHITMFASLLYGLVYFAWRRFPRLMLYCPARKAAVMAGLLAAMAYAFMAGFSVPTQRTLYMLAVFAWALWSGRNIGIGRVLSYALGVTVLLDPWAVLAPGFWLSFGAVGIIGYAAGNRIARLHWLREAVVTQWAVTLGLMPLLLVLFQQVSITSPAANAIAIPLVSLAVVPLAMAGGFLPVDWPLHLAHFLMAQLMTVLQWLAAQPFGLWQQHAPPAWTLIPALAGVLWILLPRGMPMRWLGLAGLLPMLLLVPVSPPTGAIQVAVLDVGQGLAVAIRTAHHALLYDTGPRYSSQSDSGSRIIVPYLRGEGIHRLDGLVVSHDDLDHSGGLRSVTTEMPLGWLDSALPADSPELAGVHTRSLRCVAGQRWRWDEVDFEILHPTSASYADTSIKDNNRSCVLKVSSRHGSLLLTGDIEKSAEAALLQAQRDTLAADVLVAPHHGSGTSSTPAFVAAVHPAAVVFTAGYRNRFGHPKPAVVERYQSAGSRIYRSDWDGAVMMDFSASGIAIRRWRQQSPHYWNASAEIH